MSIHIIPASSPAEARVISTEDGYNCKCRNDFLRSKPSKDLANGVSVKKESVTIDLAPLLKRRPFDSNSPITVFINCGSVPVEERRYWDVTVYNSDRMRKGQQYKSVRIDEAHEDKTHHIHGGVFRILTHPKHGINVPTNEDETSSGWTQTCSNAKHPYIDTKKLAFRILFHPQLPNFLYTRNVHLWIDNIPLKVKLRGFSIGPAVCLSRHLVNFGGIYVGNKGKRMVELHNHSLAAARFQFQVDNIRSTFKDPLLIDFVGVCVPRPRFLPAAISFGVKMDYSLAIPFPSDTVEDFTAGDQRWGVKFELERLDFGYRDPEVAYPDYNSGIPVNAESCLPYDAVLEWAPDPSKVFTVSPSCATLPANGEFVFSLNFKPNFPGAFYDATLECYVYPATENYDEGGPPWNYSFSDYIRTPADINNKKTSPPENSDILPRASIAQVDIRKSTVVTLSVPEEMIQSASPSAKKLSPKTRRQTSANASQSHLLADSKHKYASVSSEDLYAEHGYYMKVNMSRLNEGQDINFMVTPISKKVNEYDLPEMLLADEVISRHVRHSSLTTNTNEYGKECGSHHFTNLHKRDNNSTGDNNSSSRAPSGSGSEEASGELHATISTNIPSIHPSKLFLPGTDQASTSVALDGVKRIALPLCVSLKLTGHTFTPQRVPFIPNVKLPLKAVMYASTPNSSTGRTFLIKNLSDLPCFYSLDQGVPQWVEFSFPTLKEVQQISIQFQGGFAAKSCVLECVGENETSDSKDVKAFEFYPKDSNETQIFVSETLLSSIKFKLTFTSSFDFLRSYNNLQFRYIRKLIVNVLSKVYA